MSVKLSSERVEIGHTDTNSGVGRYISFNTSIDTFVTYSCCIVTARNYVLACADGWCSTRSWGTHAATKAAARHTTVDTRCSVSVIANIITRLTDCART